MDSAFDSVDKAAKKHRVTHRTGAYVHATKQLVKAMR